MNQKIKIKKVYPKCLYVEQEQNKQLLHIYKMMINMKTYGGEA